MKLHDPFFKPLFIISSIHIFLFITKYVMVLEATAIIFSELGGNSGRCLNPYISS